MFDVETMKRLRIFIGEDDKYQGRPLYEEILVKAQASGMAGATIFRGFMGYGKSSGLNIDKILRRSNDLPVVIEILDSEAKVKAFVNLLDHLLKSGIASVETVEIHKFKRKVVAVADGGEED